MGKLAERYLDAARSGVYRVRDPAIPRTAAAEAGAALLEIDCRALANGGWPRVEAFVATRGEGSCVILLAGAHGAGGALIDALAATANACRDAGRPCFVVLVDPLGELALPPLYKERAS